MNLQEFEAANNQIVYMESVLNLLSPIYPGTKAAELLEVLEAQKDDFRKRLMEKS